MSQIHQELLTLKSELDKLETVRQNFESARQVTTSIVKELASQSEKLNDHISQVIPIYDKHLQENLRQTQDKLVVTQNNIENQVNQAVLQWLTVADSYQQGLSNHIETIQKQLEDSQQIIENRFSETSSQWKTAAVMYQKSLPNHIQAVQKQLEDGQKIIENKTNETTKKWKDVADNHNASLAEHLKKLQNEFEKSGKSIENNVFGAIIPITELNKQIERFLFTLNATHKQIEKLTLENEQVVDEIRKINFPARLDKVDNTISAINLGLQNVQSRVSDTERNLKESVINLEKNLLNEISILESKVNTTKTFQWVILFLLLIVIALLAAIFMKR